MRVVPVAYDSMGVRAMATYVETDDLRVFIDPSVSLAPIRYGLPPHELEWSRLREMWHAIRELALQSDVLVVTHYHYDHHNPQEPDIYEGKVALLKHPRNHINMSQRRRAAYFLELLEGLPSRIEFCDGSSFGFGDTLIEFSKPVFHGTNPRLGYVVEVSVSCGDEKLLHTSDVEGPSVEDQVDFILSQRPGTLIVDGPMTYMLGYRYSAESLRLSNQNLVRVIRETDVETIVIDHHFMRDPKFRSRIQPVYEAASEGGVRVLSAAEYVGRPIEMLEAFRRELYRGEATPEVLRGEEV